MQVGVRGKSFSTPVLSSVAAFEYSSRFPAGQIVAKSCRLDFIGLGNCADKITQTPGYCAQFSGSRFTSNAALNSIWATSYYYHSGAERWITSWAHLLLCLELFFNLLKLIGCAMGTQLTRWIPKKYNYPPSGYPLTSSDRESSASEDGNAGRSLHVRMIDVTT